MASSSERYRAELPEDTGPFKRLLQEYSYISPEVVDSHIHKIRDQAYTIAPYPSFGLRGFTRIRVLEADPNYQLVISRLTAPGSHDALLDLGCGLGQNIRQLVHAGVPPAKLFAADLRWDLIALGFELFQDRDRLKEATFLVGDALNPDDPELSKIDGKISIIHAANIFHLFSWDAQVKVGTRMARLLHDREEAFIFGGQIGSLEPGARETSESASEKKYLHDQKSFQMLWDEVGGKTGTGWRVEVEMLGKTPLGYVYLPHEIIRYSRFVVWKI